MLVLGGIFSNNISCPAPDHVLAGRWLKLSACSHREKIITTDGGVLSLRATGPD